MRDATHPSSPTKNHHPKMGKSSKSLKSALQSQQSRLKLKEKEKAAQAAKAALQKGKKLAQGNPNAKGKRKAKADSVDDFTSASSISSRPVAGTSTSTSASPLDRHGSHAQATRRPTIPFRPTDTILLIGEGNFSFTRALVLHPPASVNSGLDHLPPRNVTATAFDSEEECYEKYPGAEEIVRGLKEKGVEVRFGVDATKLERVSGFKGRKWDRIVWNFPHAGKGITDQDRNILSNQMLILGFLRSAAKFLKSGTVPVVNRSGKKKRKPDDDEDDEAEEDREMDVDEPAPHTNSSERGTILITLRNVSPYTLWDVPKLAKNPPPPTQGSNPPNPRYTLLRSFAFHRRIWQGYVHRMTKGERAHGTGKTGEGGEDRTWEFCLRDV
ncbi:hypothetical protein D9758_002477 [Tetrapyrgos nigripes]|uniref:25S rRNA (uridine-N(3))-methyltransferase BMT5-like domain-containing protein n=1 Tax=Tetrapyrgos nigripes TaxID=182062 RepID=A0A8H5LSN1_9AGAR|nr:hypothetical protein D9758_002477 [Tetrapyrgos nigripes]